MNDGVWEALKAEIAKDGGRLLDKAEVEEFERLRQEAATPPKLEEVKVVPIEELERVKSARVLELMEGIPPTKFEKTQLPLPFGRIGILLSIPMIILFVYCVAQAFSIGGEMKAARIQLKK